MTTRFIHNDEGAKIIGFYRENETIILEAKNGKLTLDCLLAQIYNPAVAQQYALRAKQRAKPTVPNRHSCD